ncbi:hypothetical protein KKB99_05220, partial [bacterium]|nr:hypothetical protein [bacterium]MBU1025397.1 hypothetical protein [bacterium]
MKKGILFTIVILLMMICSMVSAQESESSSNDEALRKEGRPRISVKTFENPSMYYNSSIGTGVTDMLITILVQSGRFNVIARNESFEEL